MTKTTEPPRLTSLSSLVREIAVPGELAFAFATDRVELLRLIKPKPLDASQSAKLYEIIGVLMETNQALRNYAARMTVLAEDLGGSIEEIIAAQVDINETAAHAKKATAQVKRLASFRDAED
jgi:hypothetical protein